MPTNAKNLINEEEENLTKTNNFGFHLCTLYYHIIFFISEDFLAQIRLFDMDFRVLGVFSESIMT